MDIKIQCYILIFLFLYLPALAYEEYHYQCNQEAQYTYFLTVFSSHFALSFFFFSLLFDPLHLLLLQRYPWLYDKKGY